jgi:NSS family neurotransmitter:Na+ symporter
MKDMLPERPQWQNNLTYMLVAIGCAAGLGNFWRFPMLAYEYGGAAFILALLISNLIIVLPLLMAETAIGQKYSLSAPQSSECLKPKTSWIQWIAVFSAIVILMYYVPVMAWAMKYLLSVFPGDFLENPSTYFITDILHLSSDISVLGGFQIELLFALILCYILILLSLHKQIKSVSRVVKITVSLPIILISFLIIRSITLPGAFEGLSVLFIPEWSKLTDITLWKAAIAQSFFSASLALGYFMTAASYRPKNAEIPRTSLLILGGNFIVSLLSGIAVFSTLGFMSLEQGAPVSEVAHGGPMLVFTTLPTAISMMPIAPILFATLLFIVIITLAIDSIFGLLEVITSAFYDFLKPLLNIPYTSILFGTVSLTFLGSFPFLFGAGLYYLDIVDHFVTDYLILLVGLLESIMIVFFVGPEKIRKSINEYSKNWKIGKWFNIFFYCIPLILGILWTLNIYREIGTPYEGYPSQCIILLGILPVGIVCVLSLFFGYFTYKSFLGKK